MSSSSRIVGRTLARCQALQLLFQAEACGRSVADVLAGDYVLSEGPLVEYGEQLARGTDEHRAELDHVLSGAARNWSISRMSATDRNLLRVAECVELAKAFGSSDESSRFVNGVLGRVAVDIDNGIDVIEVARKNYEASAAELASAAYGDEDDREYAPEEGFAPEHEDFYDGDYKASDVPEWAREGE
mgnify:CR=1 FL=1